MRPEIEAGAGVALTGRAGIVRGDAGVVNCWDAETAYLVWKGLAWGWHSAGGGIETLKGTAGVCLYLLSRSYNDARVRVQLYNFQRALPIHDRQSLLHNIHESRSPNLPKQTKKVSMEDNRSLSTMRCCWIRDSTVSETSGRNLEASSYT